MMSIAVYHEQEASERELEMQKEKVGVMAMMSQHEVVL
jgi:hypothetical protein